MGRYAVINLETGYVEGESYLGEINIEEYSRLKPIDFDFDLANKKWDFETETWVEYVPEEPEPVDPVPDPVMEKLDSIEAKIQTNEDLKTFYDDIVKEVGL